MRLLSELQRGYLPGDNLEGVHQDLLHRYYGTEGPPRRRRAGQTGAGHSDSEHSISDLEDDTR